MALGRWFGLLVLGLVAMSSPVGAGWLRTTALLGSQIAFRTRTATRVRRSRAFLDRHPVPPVITTADSP